MRHEPRKYLWDARDAIESIETFLRDKSFDAFANDRLLRSAVERQFEIIGEALAQLARNDPALAARIPDSPRIVAFRNILIHGYAVVDHALVWRVTQENLPQLRRVLDGLLAEH